jgi:hypothetical protein
MSVRRNSSLHLVDLTGSQVGRSQLSLMVPRVSINVGRRLTVGKFIERRWDRECSSRWGGWGGDSDSDEV